MMGLRVWNYFKDKGYRMGIEISQEDIDKVMAEKSVDLNTAINLLQRGAVNNNTYSWGNVNKNADLKYNSDGTLMTAPGNSVTGDFKASEGGYWLGGVKEGVSTSGVLEPAFNLGMGAWNAYQSYAALKETEKNNAARVELANEGIYMKRVDQHNKVAKQRRYQNIGVTSANSNPIAAIAANPYTKYRPFEMKY